MTRKILLSIIIAAAVNAASSASAAVIAVADFFTPLEAPATTIQGSLGGNIFTITNLEDASLSFLDVSGSDFSADPLSASQETVRYRTSSSFTINFNAPVDNLLFYAIGFRGDTGGVPNATQNYSFNSPFTILSGLGNAVNVTTTSFTVPDGTGFGNGILSFANPITTLTLSTDAVGGLQAFTFAQADAVVPLPATLPLFLAGLVGLGVMGRKKRQAAG